MDYDDHGLAAMPKLVGGPRYSRPPAAGGAQTERPPDPDDLPLVAERTPEDHEVARELGIDLTMGTSATAVATNAVLEAAGHAPYPDGPGTKGPAAESPMTRRGLSGLFRGRNSQSNSS